MIKTGRISAIASCVLLVAILSGLLTSPAWGQQPDRVKVLIAFGRQPGPAEEALVRGMGGSVKYTYHLVPAIAATLPETVISALAANPHVTRVEPDLQMRAMDFELDNSWGVVRIGAGTVHEGEDGNGNRGEGIRIVIIDSGINYDHPDLDGNYVGGYDFVEDDGFPMDVYGHGTHVAGTACADDNDNGDPDGPYGVVGVAPACALYGVRVLDDGGYGFSSTLIAAMEWAVDNEMQVANLSLGWDLNPGELVREAFDNAWGAGLVTVAAACNNGNPPGRGDNVCYPALYESVIAVAATDDNDQRARFSSTGAQVELAAPGVSVFSTWNDETGYYDPQPVCRGEDGYDCYKYGSGTSMASPHVAGTAALILAADPTLTNDEVRTRLRDTADDLGAVGRDPLYGFGLVDAAEAAVGPPNELPTVAITAPEGGATVSGTVEVTADADDPGGTGVLQVEFFVDGDRIGVDADGSDGWSADWITVDYTDGSYTVSATATNAAGTTTDSVQVTVDNVDEPPEVSITYPLEGSTVSGLVTVTADANDDGEVDQVEFFVDGESIGGGFDGDTWSATWDTQGLESTHSIAAVAIDDADQRSTDNVQVTVDNTAQPTMHIGDLVGFTSNENKNFWWAGVSALVLDQNEEPVANATVTGAWSDGASGTSSCLTDGAGQCTAISPKMTGTSVTFTVVDVSHPSLEYDASQNTETHIVIDK